MGKKRSKGKNSRKKLKERQIFLEKLRKVEKLARQ